jgi:polysaccharide export outer membrane protein
LGRHRNSSRFSPRNWALPYYVIFFSLLAFSSFANAEEPKKPQGEYAVGIDDVLDITILQPDKLMTSVTVAPDGSISFPYIGRVQVKGVTLPEIEQEIQTRLADGYMKYPVASVSLRESRSRKFFVYGEVTKPGPYAIEENTTVLRAISMAGGFTKYGSSSRVKVLRPKKDKPGYETIKVNIRAIMDGDAESDLLIQLSDIVIVSEGIF